MSAQPIKKARHENLTLHNWMTVYSYMDSLPQPIKQGDVIRYFAMRAQGTLLFSQATLSCKLQQHTEMEACVESIPNALSSKRPHVVTRCHYLDLFQLRWQSGATALVVWDSSNFTMIHWTMIPMRATTHNSFMHCPTSLPYGRPK